MSATATDYCSEISAMRVRMDEMHDIMQTVLAMVRDNHAAPDPAPKYQYEDYYLDDVEKSYLINCKDLQSIWMVCERTAYRYLKKYKIMDVSKTGAGQFRLGDITAITSLYGIDFSRKEIMRILEKRRIKCPIRK